ncbi:hypothetical protein SVIOM74S_05519 [Streptomyces violarus]
MATHAHESPTLKSPGRIDFPSPEWTPRSGAISYLR